MICTYCKKDPGIKPNGLWKGFRDNDTGQLVCQECRNSHYKAKSKTEFAHLYSEVPVQVMHQLNLF